MPIDKSVLSRAIGDDIRRAERSIEAALRDVAQLTISAIEASHTMDMTGSVAHTVLAPLSGAYADLIAAHAGVVRKAHPTFEKIGRRMGLAETDWGGSDQKASAAELEALPERPPVAA